MEFKGWTSQQVETLAPDAKSVKTARGLVAAAKWPLLGGSARALWGHCQGSGKNPYQVQIDLGEPAFKCSCPSRKFPCKHGLALFFLAVEQSGCFTSTEEEPEWVTEWLDKRSARKEKKAAKSKEVDPIKQQKRQDSREGKVKDALAALDIWLRDLLREGLATARQRPHSFWDNMAARLVDGQAGGLARMVRSIPSMLSGTSENNNELLLKQLAKLNLAIEAYERQKELPSGLKADVRSIIGWNVREDNLANEPTVKDDWAVVGQRQDEDDNLRVQRTWLLGKSCGSYALLLQFAYGRQPFKLALPVGYSMEAELIYYPSAAPRRVLLKSKQPAMEVVSAFSGYENFEQVLECYSETLARNPWTAIVPAAISMVLPVTKGEKRLLIDSSNHSVPINQSFEKWWHLVSLSGGEPIEVFGEWNGTSIFPLSACVDGRFISFAGGLT